MSLETLAALFYFDEMQNVNVKPGRSCFTSSITALTRGRELPICISVLLEPAKYTLGTPSSLERQIGIEILTLFLLSVQEFLWAVLVSLHVNFCTLKCLGSRLTSTVQKN